jgi:hypothetical protein
MEFKADHLGSAQDFYEFFASIPENLRPLIPIRIMNDEDLGEDVINAGGELYVSTETEGGLDGGITLFTKIQL